MKKFYSFFVAFIASFGLIASAQSVADVCGTYSWMTAYDEFYTVVVKPDKTENGLILADMFDKYEVKGTYDPATGSVYIENQRVGFDADNGQFLSFVHLTYGGEIDSEPLELMEADGWACYEEYGVVYESLDGDYLYEGEADLLEYGYMAFITRIGDLPTDEWEDAGTAILFDGGFFTPLPRFGIGFKAPVEVVLEKSTETEGHYRLVNPWNSYFDKELDSYLVFDISNPDCVIIPTQSTGVMDEEYGLASVQNFVGMYIAAGFDVDDAYAAIPTDKQDKYICTYNDNTKVITMPVGSTFTTFAKDEYYWNVGSNYGATDSYIVMPGGSSGFNSIVSDVETPAEYFNLQGIRVAPAEGGLYIVRKGATVTKHYIK